MMVRRHEIGLEKIKGIRIGQAENTDAGTGCTVFLSDQGMTAGLDVRGGGPAPRESELLNPLAAAQVIHGIVLAGGSAFGLNAADGVMQYLEERGIGFDVGLPIKVPLVCQSDLFDLTVGDPCVRPDKEMGYAACVKVRLWRSLSSVRSCTSLRSGTGSSPNGSVTATFLPQPSLVLQTI